MSAPSIEDLKEAERTAEQAWRAAAAALHDAMKAAHPIQPGDILTSKAGKRALVKYLIVKYGGVEPVGLFARKDGTWSTVERVLYGFDWHNAAVSKADRQTP
jgi:hypothetical protein